MVLNFFQESHAHSGGSGLVELEHVAILGLLLLILVSTMSETVIVPNICGLHFFLSIYPFQAR